MKCPNCGQETLIPGRFTPADKKWLTLIGFLCSNSAECGIFYTKEQYDRVQKEKLEANVCPPIPHHHHKDDSIERTVYWVAEENASTCAGCRLGRPKTPCPEAKP